MASKSSPPLGGREPGGKPGITRHGRGRPARSAGLSGLGALTVAGLVAACGSTGGSAGTAGSTGSAGTGSQARASHRSMVSARSLPGVGTVLVDRSGKTVYSPQQEAHGKIVCTAGCLSFWFPVPVAPGAALHAPGALTGVLGKIHRADDGLTQLTYNGKPLYTFRLDQAPGQVHGNNFTDRFGSVSFTWQAVTSGAAAGTGGQGGSSGGYPSQGGSSGY